MPAAHAHQLGELFVYNFDDHLRGRQAFHNGAADGALCDLIRKILRYLIVDVRFQKRQAHLAHGFLYVDSLSFSLRAQLLNAALSLSDKPSKAKGDHPFYFLLFFEPSGCIDNDARAFSERAVAVFPVH